MHVGSSLSTEHATSLRRLWQAPRWVRQLLQGSAPAAPGVCIEPVVLLIWHRLYNGGAVLKTTIKNDGAWL